MSYVVDSEEDSADSCPSSELLMYKDPGWLGENRFLLLEKEIPQREILEYSNYFLGGILTLKLAIMEGKRVGSVDSGLALDLNIDGLA